jgi:peptidoglycan/xylan/chitin deacetylase (PgdA/CDA1 family)
MKKRLFISFVVVLVVGIIGYSYLGRFYVVPILMYHHIDDISRHGTNNVLVENFARQMEFLHKYNYNVISLDELVEGIRSKRRFPKNSVVITFDDGYENNYTHAYPYLKKYDFKAIIFIPPDSVGEENFLSWGQIRQMLEDDIAFGSHTRSQAYLPDIQNRKRLLDEIAGSKRIIESELKVPVDYFCYPVGGFNEEIKKIVRDSGYKAACTTNRGFDKLNQDLFELNRIKITDSDANYLHFWVKLSGYYNLFRHPRNPY